MLLINLQRVNKKLSIDNFFYHIPSIFCRHKLVRMIPIQQANPKNIGFPPVFTNFITSVFNPIAAIAMIIKNLLKFLNGENRLAGIWNKLVQIVVINDAAINQIIKKGNIFF